MGVDPQWGRFPPKEPTRTKSTTEGKFITGTKFATTIAKQYGQRPEVFFLQKKKNGE